MSYFSRTMNHPRAAGTAQIRQGVTRPKVVLIRRAAIVLCIFLRVSRLNRGRIFAQLNFSRDPNRPRMECPHNQATSEWNSISAVSRLSMLELQKRTDRLQPFGERKNTENLNIRKYSSSFIQSLRRYPRDNSNGAVV